MPMEYGEKHRNASRPNERHRIKCDVTWLTRCSIEIDCKTAIIVMSRRRSHWGKINYHLLLSWCLCVRACVRTKASVCLPACLPACLNCGRIVWQKQITKHLVMALPFLSRSEFHFFISLMHGCACAKMFGTRSYGWARTLMKHKYLEQQKKSNVIVSWWFGCQVCTQSLKFIIWNFNGFAFSSLSNLGVSQYST